MIAAILIDHVIALGDKGHACNPRIVHQMAQAVRRQPIQQRPQHVVKKAAMTDDSHPVIRAARRITLRESSVPRPQVLRTARMR